MGHLHFELAFDEAELSAVVLRVGGDLVEIGNGGAGFGWGPIGGVLKEGVEGGFVDLGGVIGGGLELDGLCLGERRDSDGGEQDQDGGAVGDHGESIIAD